MYIEWDSVVPFIHYRPKSNKKSERQKEAFQQGDLNLNNYYHDKEVSKFSTGKMEHFWTHLYRLCLGELAAQYLRNYSIDFQIQY